MNRLVGLLVICPDRHDSYLRVRSNRWNPPMTTRNRCVVDHRLSNNELFRMIAIDKKYNQSFLLTFILLGYFSSTQELSYRPSQHVFRHKQRTDEQRKTVLGK